jgi:hypothetical protein
LKLLINFAPRRKIITSFWVCREKHQGTIKLKMILVFGAMVYLTCCSSAGQCVSESSLEPRPHWQFLLLPSQKALGAAAGLEGEGQRVLSFLVSLMPCLWERVSSSRNDFTFLFFITFYSFDTMSPVK